MKIWISREKGDTNIIAFDGKLVYKGSPPIGHIDRCVMDLSMGISCSYIMAVPLRFIVRIRTELGEDTIDFIGAGTDHSVRVSDLLKKEEIFVYFREHVPGAVFSVDTRASLQAVNRKFVGLFILLAIFLWALYLSLMMGNGVQYEVPGGHSISGIVLVLADLGPSNLSMLFLPVLFVMLVSAIKKKRNPPVIYSLEIKRLPGVG